MGKILVQMASYLAKHKIGPYAGCRFIIADVKETTEAFYQKTRI